jgi:hypothetical protein
MVSHVVPLLGQAVLTLSCMAFQRVLQHMTIVSFPLTWCIPLYPFQQGLNLALGGSGLGVGATLSKFVSSLHSLPQLDDCGGSLYLPFLYSLKNYFYSYILIIQSEGFHHDASYMYIMYFDHIFPLYYSL